MTETIQTTHQSIHPATDVGNLKLSVADLARSLNFYTNEIGLHVLDQQDGRATLGAGGRPILILQEQPGAEPWPRGDRSYPGLYHFAILLPNRVELGRWLQHWMERGNPPPGQGDHVVSEALYLEDPDGHGIEIYRDRPRSEWHSENGRVVMGTGPVDIRGILEEGQSVTEPWTGMPPGTKLGHVHLQVGSIPEAERFYVDTLGFDVMAKMPTALFISAGRYHHHLGLNTWHSQGAGPAPENSVRLKHFTIDLPNDGARDEVVNRLDSNHVPYRRDGDVLVTEDPWGNEIHLRVRK